MKIYDLSLPIDDNAPEPFPVKVERTGHGEGGDRVGEKLFQPGKKKLDRNCFPDGIFLSHESVTASVHCGTHVDAPYHFGPECEGSSSMMVDDLPLEWYYSDGVVLDMTHKTAGSEIITDDLLAALTKIDYTLKPSDIVLIRTDADRHFGTPAYSKNFPGVAVSAIEYLLDNGIKVIGIDAVSFDRPFLSMLDDYDKSGDNRHLWPAHILGRRRQYSHIERLANLGSLPRPHGFKFACFPVKIKGAGAAWARAVAIFEDQED